MNITLYTKATCVYCWRAKWLLRRRGLAYTEIAVDRDPERRAWLAQVTGQSTVPQIFLDERSIGGFSELRAADQRGELARWLQGAER